MKKTVKLTLSHLKRMIMESLRIISNSEYVDNEIERIFHFSEIPTEELERQYVDYSVYDEFRGFKTYARLNEDKDIRHQAQNAKERIMSVFHLKDWQVEVTKIGEYKVEIIILMAGLFRNKERIKEEMKHLGFFTSKTKIARRGFMLWNAIQFEPYMQDDFTNEATSFGWLFHLTPLRNMNTIMQEGLLPKSENSRFDYPNRVYVLKGDVNSQEVEYIGTQLYDFDKKRHKNNDGTYVVIGIETSKLPANVRFYGDPLLDFSYFTYDAIPKEALRIIKNMNFKRK